MGITLQHLVDLEQALGQPCDRDSFELAADRLKASANLVIMRCDASDVLEEPFRSYASYDLHLIDGSTHCPKVTNDLGSADGLLLAWRGMAA